jgi:hypothetical protein
LCKTVPNELLDIGHEKQLKYFANAHFQIAEYDKNGMDGFGDPQGTQGVAKR